MIAVLVQSCICTGVLVTISMPKILNHSLDLLPSILSYLLFDKSQQYWLPPPPISHPTTLMMLMRQLSWVGSDALAHLCSVQAVSTA